MLKDNGIPKPERVKVLEMCKRINSNNQSVQITVANVCTGMNPYQMGIFYCDDFMAASNAIADAIGITYPQQQQGRSRYRNVSGLQGNYNGGCNGRGQGRCGGRGHGGINGNRNND